jgi:phosphate:Na+ symporter
MAVANYIESIGDIIETNLVEAGNRRLDQDLWISASTQQVLQALHDQVFWAVEASLEAWNSSEERLAQEVMAAKLEVNQRVFEAESHLARQLRQTGPNRLATFRIETEIVEYLKRVYYYAKRIAKVTADTELVYKQVEIKRTPEELMPA